MDALRVGVVGGGLIAQAIHLPTLRSLDDRYRVVALADPSRRVRERVCARFGIPRPCAHHGRLLEADDLDAVLVCSPAGTHASVALDALAAGLHVFVEKPLALTAEDARRVAARARVGDRVLQVGYMKRFDQSYERLVAAPPAAPRHVRCTTIDPAIGRLLAPAGLVLADDVPERVTRELAAATAAAVAEAVGSDDPWHVRPYAHAFLGALVHDVNAVLGILDAAGIEGAIALDGFAEAGGTLACGTAALPGGARCSFAWLLAPAADVFTEEIELVGEDGVHTLRFGAPYVRNAPAPLQVSGRALFQAYGDAYTRELEHFHDCVTRGTPCRTPPEQAERDIALLAGMYRAVVAERERASAGAAA